MVKLSVIIPTKDRDEIFKATLRSALEAIQHLDAEIIVINDSKTSTPSVPENAENVKLFDNPKPGVASARNTGVKNSSGDLLLFLDNDIIISKDSIDHVIALHNQYQMACFNVDWRYPLVLQDLLTTSSFGRFVLTHGMTSFKGWYNNASWQEHALFTSSSVASFHLSISRANFERTGGYDEQFPDAGFEDYDFPTKLKKAGLAFYIDSRVVVDHNESDRLGLDNWLANQERRAATRKVAVNLGYKELQLHYGFAKRFLLSSINFFYPVLQIFLRFCPNYNVFDPLYFKCVSGIQAARIYKGYNSISTS